MTPGGKSDLILWNRLPLIGVERQAGDEAGMLGKFVGEAEAVPLRRVHVSRSDRNALLERFLKWLSVSKNEEGKPEN